MAADTPDPTDPEELRALVHELTAAYEKRLAELQTLIRAARKTCPHPAARVRYEPDPSGNNDSSYECDLCGGSFRRNPTKT